MSLWGLDQKLLSIVDICTQMLAHLWHLYSDVAIPTAVNFSRGLLAHVNAV
jgi:hypothetical protein